MEGMVSVRLLLQSLVLVSLRIVSGPLRSAPQVVSGSSKHGALRPPAPLPPGPCPACRFFLQLLKPYALKEDLAVFVRPWMCDMWLALFSMGKKPMISLKISGNLQLRKSQTEALSSDSEAFPSLAICFCVMHDPSRPRQKCPFEASINQRRPVQGRWGSHRWHQTYPKFVSTLTQPII
ncbi:Uncharacterized protein HZ326_7929 [Fusarium oxysporum f. sp. albedinis]|nr:Uncharacterized protein HZ326_7929 [Fusarium oxysporum f. sp. albedinis]